MSFATTISIPPLTHGRRAIAEMAVIREREAARRLWIGDYAGAEGQLYSADALFRSALDHIGRDGAHLDQRVR